MSSQKAKSRNRATSRKVVASPSVKVSWDTTEGNVRTTNYAKHVRRHGEVEEKNFFEGYYLTVRQGDDMLYRPVRIDGDYTLAVSNYPTQVYKEVNSDLRELWKRAAVDEAIPFDCYGVDPKTMKLVKFTMKLEDCTREMFFDRDDMNNQKRNAALSKLSEEEAKLLGLSKEYALVKLFRSDRDEHDKQLMSRLRGLATGFEYIDE